LSVTLKQLEIFNAVVVAGSISKAARWLRLSQPTISQTLAKMEETLHTQLIHRNRAADLRLTPAGEYWFRSSCDLLRQMQEIGTFHDAHFREESIVIRLGATPSLRGRFIGVAARLAIAQPRFSRFEFVWSLNSDAVVKHMIMHQINCGVVRRGAQRDAARRAAFRRPIVWAVPRCVSTGAVEAALATRKPPRGHDALTRYVEVGGVPWHARTEGWYRQKLPFAMPISAA